MTKLQLKYRELKIISVIAASENISHAATVLGIAQANVSKYLADFESKVGLKSLTEPPAADAHTFWYRAVTVHQRHAGQKRAA